MPLLLNLRPARPLSRAYSPPGSRREFSCCSPTGISGIQWLQRRIGQIIRRKLGLKTERLKTGYVIASTETPKLARLYEKYGIETEDEAGVNLVNSVNSPLGEEEEG
jgi:hypothetical protein